MLKMGAAAASREKPLMIPNSNNFFSELEVNAIELLVQLSGSSCCNGGSTEEESDVKSRAAPPTFFAEDEDEEEVSFGPRKKRFRSISELYKLIEPLNLVIVAAKENKRKRKRKRSI
ncbi:hypothetical protein PRUPE_1G186100 [Prunus persica]|uniref:Uncharacterized protein n=1 Tax=Prunus persica TaxID=3760 RepID=A0A251QZL3_PRUPE|nr:hypothetical protein PRUPE_1G186100 [Prunus persica]